MAYGKREYHNKGPVKIYFDGLTSQQRFKQRYPDYDRKRWAELSDQDKIETHLKRRYKLNYQDVVDLFEKQEYCCAVCLTPVELKLGNDINRGVVDHCHETKRVRGILCHHCNRAIGLLKDNKDNVKRLLNYLGD